MLISYDRPDDITFTLIGIGAAWLSDDAGAALANGRPASVSRIQWLSGAQTTASELILRATWGTALVPRVLGMVGLTLPVGTLIKLALRRPADADYTYLADTYSQRVVELPDGSRCAWFVLPAALDAIIGVAFQILNDVDGAATIPADSAFDVGEVWVGRTADIPHQRGWTRGVKDPSVIRRSRGGQVFGSELRAWRTLSVQFAPGTLAEVAGDGLATGADWEQIEAALLGTSPCVVVPRWQDASYVQRNAMFARASEQKEVQHLGGSWFGRAVTFEEIPAAAAE